MGSNQPLPVASNFSTNALPTELLPLVDITAVFSVNKRNFHSEGKQLNCFDFNRWEKASSNWYITNVQDSMISKQHGVKA